MGNPTEGGAGGRQNAQTSEKEETTQVISCLTGSRTDEVCQCVGRRADLRLVAETRTQRTDGMPAREIICSHRARTTSWAGFALILFRRAIVIMAAALKHGLNITPLRRAQLWDCAQRSEKYTSQSRGTMSTATLPSPIRGEPELLGQTVVVIGGSAGIGFETARRARGEGAG